MNESLASGPTTYWQRSSWPLQSLIFLLPVLLFYELGTVLFTYDPERGVTVSIYAQALLRDAFAWLGATGYYLPGFIVVGALLGMHVWRGDRWWFEPKLYLVMWAEAVLLSVPLFVFMLAMFRGSGPFGEAAGPEPLHSLVMLQTIAGHGAADGSDPASGWVAQVVFSLGAGIYEELLFRLIAIAVIHGLLVDLLKMPDVWGAVIAVGVSAVAFALYHFNEGNAFDPNRFVFYTGAGVYFAGIYVVRGFGIVAGTHAVYDILVVVMLWKQSGSS